MLDKKLRLTVFFGLIASGKSTLAKAWAAGHSLAYFNSDLVRKELAGLLPAASGAAPFQAGIYTPEFTEKTYTALHTRALTTLQNGCSVVLDASYATARHRQAARDLALNTGARIRFIHCTCPEQETQRRLAQRSKDPGAVSDGTWQIYLTQKEHFEPLDDVQDCLLSIRTDLPLPSLLQLLDNET